MTDLRELASRCERAKWTEQAEILIDAWDAVASMKGEAWAAECVKSFCAMLDAEAYESAALTLVPEGWTFANLSQSDRKGWWCELRRGHLTSFDATAFGSQLENASPALALCAAALRALATTREQSNHD